MGIFNEFYKKEKPVFTGITRGIGGFGFGGGGASGPSFSASGGSKYQPGDGYVYHAFTNPNSDDFIVDGDGTIDVLIVAGGGGGGGGYYSGGAGAGGLVFGPNVPITAGTYTVTVGAGGAGSAGPGVNNDGVNGGNSSFDSVTALGGGFGGSGPRTEPPPMGAADGGSGGGAPQYKTSAKGAASPQPVPSDYTAYGNAGGTAAGSQGAGGGGAGAAGGAPAPPVMVGGDGQPIPAFEGPKIPILVPVVPLMGPDGTYYAGGGGGGKPAAPEANLKGGFGGGGAGNPGSTVSDPTGFPGTDYLGGGGGGIGNSLGGGGDGGDGIVLVRYLE